MPNHYQNILVCKPGYDFDVDDFLSKHKDTNWCNVVKPIPERLEEVNVVVGKPNYVKVGDEKRELTEDDNRELVRQFGSSDWYDWAYNNWGTKWGTYETQALQLSGDGCPVIISFQTAWSPPLENISGAIAYLLHKHHGFTSIDWFGCDPYDDSTSIILAWKWEGEDDGRI